MVDVSADLLTYENQLFSRFPTRVQLDRLQLEHTLWVASLRDVRGKLSDLTLRAQRAPESIGALAVLDDALNESIEIPFTQVYADLAIARTLWGSPTKEGIGDWPKLDLPEPAVDPTSMQLQGYLAELASAAPLARVELGVIRQALAAHVHNVPAGLSQAQSAALTFVDAATPNLLAIKQTVDRQVQLVRQADRTFPPPETFVVSPPVSLSASEPISGAFRAERFQPRRPGK